MTEKQIEAVSIRFCECSPRLAPLRVISLRLGISVQCAHRLVSRGLKNMARNGWPIEIWRTFRTAA